MITKKQFDLLYSDDVTKKEYDAIIRQIGERFDEICRKFIRKTNKSRAWYAYGNWEWYGSEGFFDPAEYQEYIEISGEWIEPPPGYDLAFPTRWLWEENWEKEMKQVSEEYEKERRIYPGR